MSRQPKISISVSHTSNSSHGKRISNIAQIPQRLCIITGELNKRRGTVDEKVSSAQAAIFGCVDHGVDPFLDSELDRIKDNGLLRAMVLQMLDTNLVSPKSRDASFVAKITCSDALLSRIRRLVRK